MQVILLEKVVNLGNLGEVVRVRDGYARNFLIPKKIARRATETALKEFEARRIELEKIQADKLAAAQAVGEKISGLVLNIAQKAGVDGRLFGSVTNMDIASELGKQGVDDEKPQAETRGDRGGKRAPAAAGRSRTTMRARPAVARIRSMRAAVSSTGQRGSAWAGAACARATPTSASSRWWPPSIQARTSGSQTRAGGSPGETGSSLTSCQRRNAESASSTADGPWSKSWAASSSVT